MNAHKIFWFILMTASVGMTMIIAGGCRESRNHVVQQISGTVQEVPLPTVPNIRNAIYAYDMSAIGDRVYLSMIERTTHGYSTARLYVSDAGSATDVNDWNDLTSRAPHGSQFTQYYAIAFATRDHGWAIEENAIRGSRTSYLTDATQFIIHETTDGGMTWYQHGVHTVSNDNWRVSSFLWNAAQALNYFSARLIQGFGGPYASQYSGQQWMSVVAPYVPGTTYPQNVNDSHIQQQDDGGPLWLTGAAFPAGTSLNAIYTSTDGQAWTEFLPDAQTMISGEEFLACGYRQGEPMALGNRFIRFRTLYVQYPRAITYDVIAAYTRSDAAGDHVWLVDSTGNVWYSRDGAKSVKQVYAGNVPIMVQREDVQFAHNDDGMWIAYGQKLLYHRYR